MIKFKFIVVLMSIGLLLSSTLSAQRNYSQEADKAFYDQHYYSAIDKYKKAYTKVKNNRVEKYRILYQIAECYRRVNDLRRTESQYKRLVRIKFYKEDPKVYLYYADALKANGKFEEAAIQYENYKKIAPYDPLGDLGVESCTLAQKWIDNPTRYIVANEKKLNSRQNDWCPVYGDKKQSTIVYTSPRDGATGNRIDNWTGQNFTDLFTVSRDRRGNWAKPTLLDKTGMVNTAANEGPACFNKRFSTLYFTRCGVEKKIDMGCKIYTSTKKGKGWAEPVLLALVPDTVDAIHPSISDDELTIYFTSNLPGGQGDMDIWVARRTKKSKEFGKPENLGSVINTPYKDEFPYLRNDTILYFASRGHVGLGSYDIFVSQKPKNGEWGKPENLKFPVNSTYDDFGIVFHRTRNEGFFTSNRKGGRGGDDIYSFVLPPLIYTLKGTIRNEKSLAAVQEVTINLEGSDGSSVETKSGLDGNYSFDSTEVKPSVTYEINVSKDNYFNGSDRITTVALENSKHFTKDFLLMPIEKKPIVLPEILYDFAKWDIKPQYRDSLSNLVQILEDNENIVIELLSHTDMIGTDQSNLDLSQKRAQSVIDYLISRDIDSRRLKAVGYGENKPRVLTKDVSRGAYTFKAGSTLTEDYIKAMPSRRKQAAANQLNRRTEFRVVSDDFVPDTKPMEKPVAQSKPKPTTIKTTTATTGTAVTANRPSAKQDTEPTPKPTATQPKVEPSIDPAAAAAATAAATAAAAATTAAATAKKPTPKVATGSIPVYTVQVGAGNLSLSQFSNLEDIRKCTGKDGITRFVSGAFQTRDEAVVYSRKAKEMGYKDAWPVKVDENRKACFE